MSWILICWIVIGVFNYGMIFGHFPNTFPNIADIFRTEDIIFGIFCGIVGPIMLLAFLIIKCLELCGFSNYKLRLRNIKFY